VAFSASFNQTSDDGKRGNGLYTQYLLKHLATPNITLNTMFNKVRHDVYKASNGKQHPKEENGLLQDVYLNQSAGVDKEEEKRRQEALRQQRLQAQQARVRQQQVQQQKKKTVVKTAGGRIGQYIDHGDGTVTDTKTKLMWKKCSEGQSGNHCSGKGKRYSWKDAMQRFKHVSFAGYNNWRMPTRKELRTLVYCSNGIPQKEAWDYTCSGKNKRKGDYQAPTIKSNAFPNVGKDAWYWSSSPNAGNSNVAWYVSFSYGNGSYKYYKGSVRLVRSGQ
jgi:uncharacterized protein (TIGR02145 family)